MLQILGLAVVYFVTGKMGTFLAIPPGYATAIWPPSGIALAGILLYGYRVWPGILLGSLLVNFPTTWVTSSSLETLISITIILVISSGAALQAIVGTYLLRRFAGFPNLLASEKEIFSFMLFGGILSSLVNSTVSVTTLVLSNRIPITNFLANWGTWWVGDVIGVFIFTPLVLIWTLSPSEVWVNRRKTISLAVLTTFLLTTVLVFYTSQKEGEQLKFEFVRETTFFKVTLEKSILMYLDTLRSLESFYSASQLVERGEFGAFVATSLNSLPGIQALEWSPIITASKRDSFEKEMHNNGFSNFQITERDSHKNILRATQRPEFVPVTFVQPYEGNEAALGYDLNSDSIRREALELARDTGEIAVTARITLVQDKGKGKGNQFGVLAFMPIYKNDFPHSNPTERRLNITGYVLLVFRGGDIVTASLKNLNTDKLSYQLIDETAPIGEQLLIASGQKEFIPFTLEEKGLFGKRLSLISSSSIPIGGRQWRFDIIPTQNYFADHRAYTAWIILLAGLLLSSLVGAFVMVSTGHSALLLRQVEERTTQLRQSEKRFRALANSAPVLIWMSGEDRLCTWFNQVWLDFTGRSMEQEMGNGWVEAVHPEDFDRCMDIYVTHFDQRKEFRTEYRLRRHDGEYRWLDDHGVPLIDEQGDFKGYIGSCSDITDRKLAGQAILNAGKKNEMLLSTACDGIHILDEMGNVVQFSYSFAQMLGYSHEETARLNVADWEVQIPQDQLVDTIKNLMIQKAKFETKHRRKDGSVIDVEINANGVELDGKQFLYASSRDITERKALERQLLTSSKEIQDLYDHAPCGYHSLGPDGTFLRINDIELEWLGRERDEVVGKMKALDFFTPESVALFHESFPKLLRDGHNEDIEFDLISKEGTTKHVSLCETAIRDANGDFLMSRTVVYDITELKNTQEKLNQLTIEQHAMLDNELVGIAKIKDRHIIWKNQAMAQIFRYEGNELVGMSTSALFPDEASYQAFGEATYSILNAYGVYRTQMPMLRKDGVIIWIDSHGSRLTEESGEFLWIITDITLQKKHEAQISKLAYHDILTGLPNRQLISDRLSQAIALAERTHQLLAVCYLDLDGFKSVNDQFGHEAGDKLLIEVAHRMQAAVRANDTVGRMGGDEFVLLLSNLEQDEDYHIVLQRVIDSINLPIFLDDVNQVSVSASIGITLFPTDKNDADTLLRRADQAMYQAKKSGRNRVCSFM